jgi:hypothetical protein
LKPGASLKEQLHILGATVAMTEDIIITAFEALA